MKQVHLRAPPNTSGDLNSPTAARYFSTNSPRCHPDFRKLLRVIEYGEFERVGGRKTLRVDVRLVGATNADLPAMADAGLFRFARPFELRRCGLATPQRAWR